MADAAGLAPGRLDQRGERRGDAEPEEPADQRVEDKPAEEDLEPSLCRAHERDRTL
jgi:hypothetical protein